MVRKNSIILSIYIFLSSIYYIFNLPIRALIFIITFFISIYFGVKIKNGFFILKVPKSLYAIVFVIFCFTFFVQLVNNTLTPFVIYYLTSPIIAYFIYSNKFNTKILSIPFYIFSFYTTYYFIINKGLFGILNSVSENYLSIILIMNLVTLYVVKIRQNEKIPILPSLLGLILSVLAIGRSGIICTLLILLIVVWFKWKFFSKFKKIISVLMFLMPIIFLLIYKWDLVYLTFNNIELFEKFTKGGIDSPSRDILKNAYLSSMNSITFFTGYNYENNIWFIHYGLNPHNSYLRLHYFSGFAFFLIIPILFITLFKLIKINVVFSGLLLSVLLRSYTDSVLFLTLFDYILVLFIMIAFFDSKSHIQKINKLKSCL